ncbi:hypothetical protein PPERSA_01384 [Pseudocohnilembus persalinus]|uniref:Uncharacterized protein n=1 Tax=Pseudocohnilembus persalinus TaxID=266149 RepID=A0A0V0QH03_PSEPJ|nr:hypothetical protein PPERSA_01384 [Pseudocohnilembus persalinus]|eukprot:KRX01481.1 hypothetical protein PPERSA_01384 [Pseudocohnilembus persalinus]
MTLEYKQYKDELDDAKKMFEIVENKLKLEIQPNSLYNQTQNISQDEQNIQSYQQNQNNQNFSIIIHQITGLPLNYYNIQIEFDLVNKKQIQKDDLYCEYKTNFYDTSRDSYQYNKYGYLTKYDYDQTHNFKNDIKFYLENVDSYIKKFICKIFRGLSIPKKYIKQRDYEELEQKPITEQINTINQRMKYLWEQPYKLGTKPITQKTRKVQHQKISDQLSNFYMKNKQNDDFFLDTQTKWMALNQRPSPYEQISNNEYKQMDYNKMGKQNVIGQMPYQNIHRLDIYDQLFEEEYGGLEFLILMKSTQHDRYLGHFVHPILSDKCKIIEGDFESQINDVSDYDIVHSKGKFQIIYNFVPEQIYYTQNDNQQQKYQQKINENIDLDEYDLKDQNNKNTQIQSLKQVRKKNNQNINQTEQFKVQNTKQQQFNEKYKQFADKLAVSEDDELNPVMALNSENNTQYTQIQDQKLFDYVWLYHPIMKKNLIQGNFGQFNKQMWSMPIQNIKNFNPENIDKKNILLNFDVEGIANNKNWYYENYSDSEDSDLEDDYLIEIKFRQFYDYNKINQISYDIQITNVASLVQWENITLKMLGRWVDTTRLVFSSSLLSLMGEHNTEDVRTVGRYHQSQYNVGNDNSKNSKNNHNISNTPTNVLVAQLYSSLKKYNLVEDDEDKNDREIQNNLQQKGFKRENNQTRKQTFKDYNNDFLKQINQQKSWEYLNDNPQPSKSSNNDKQNKDKVTLFDKQLDINKQRLNSKRNDEENQKKFAGLGGLNETFLSQDSQGIIIQQKKKDKKDKNDKNDNSQEKNYLAAKSYKQMSQQSKSIKNRSPRNNQFFLNNDKTKNQMVNQKISTKKRFQKAVNFLIYGKRLDNKEHKQKYYQMLQKMNNAEYQSQKKIDLQLMTDMEQPFQQNFKKLENSQNRNGYQVYTQYPLTARQNIHQNQNQNQQQQSQSQDLKHQFMTHRKYYETSKSQSQSRSSSQNKYNKFINLGSTIKKNNNYGNFWAVL